MTLSFGERRCFRMRRRRGEDVHDVELIDGSVLVLAHVTNLAFTRCRRRSGSWVVGYRSPSGPSTDHDRLTRACNSLRP